MLAPYINKLINHHDLNLDECQKAIAILLDTTTAPQQVAAFLVLLRAKRETSDEVFSLVQAMRDQMITISTGYPVLDIVGTGGDKANTLNISTAASILAASCGVKIIKHGNRSVSSLCGSADVLEALGISTEIEPNQVIDSVEKIGIGFCFAPNYHPLLKQLRLTRHALNVPTVFNMIAPLLNPAKTAYNLIGVFDESLLEVIADVLVKLKVKRSLVFHGTGLDELTTLGPVKMIEVNEFGKHYSILDPKELGFSQGQRVELQGGTAQTNATRLLAALSGQKDSFSDAVVLTAAAAIYIYGMTNSIVEAIPLARKHLENGDAKALLEKWVHFGACLR